MNIMKSHVLKYSSKFFLARGLCLSILSIIFSINALGNGFGYDFQFVNKTQAKPGLLVKGIIVAPDVSKSQCVENYDSFNIYSPTGAHTQATRLQTKVTGGSACMGTYTEGHGVATLVLNVAVDLGSTSPIPLGSITLNAVTTSNQPNSKKIWFVSRPPLGVVKVIGELSDKDRAVTITFVNGN